MVDVHTKNNETCNNAIMSPCLIIYMIPNEYPLGFVGEITKCKVSFLGLVKHTGMGNIEIHLAQALISIMSSPLC